MNGTEKFCCFCSLTQNDFILFMKWHQMILYTDAIFSILAPTYFVFPIMSTKCSLCCFAYGRPIDFVATRYRHRSILVISPILCSVFRYYLQMPAQWDHRDLVSLRERHPKSMNMSWQMWRHLRRLRRRTLPLGAVFLPITRSAIRVASSRKPYQ